MPRTCTVCAHEDAVLINEALVLHKISNRSIAKQYGVDHNAVQRHREHIPRLLVKAAEAEEIAQADDLVHEIKTMVTRVRAFIDKAEAADDGPEFRAHAAEWRKQVELLAKIAGELQQEGTTKKTTSSSRRWSHRPSSRRSRPTLRRATPCRMR